MGVFAGLMSFIDVTWTVDDPRWPREVAVRPLGLRVEPSLLIMIEVAHHCYALVFDPGSFPIPILVTGLMVQTGIGVLVRPVVHRVIQ